MDFGDEDDEEWDANELAALEAQAVNDYASTQQKTQVQTHSHNQNPNTILETNTSQNLKDDQSTSIEKQRLEKLLQDKQGELLILKNNIARTNAEHTLALDNANLSSRTIREDLLRQLDVYKDRVVRLETDVTFQRQELKEAKLKTLQLSKANQSSPQSSGRYINRVNGFPSKNGFTKDDIESDLLPRLSPRKRKRPNKTAQETPLDDFELAEERARLQAAARGVVHVQKEADVHFPDTPMADIENQPSITRENTNGSVLSNLNGLPDEAVQQWVPSIITVHSRILSAIANNGIKCIEGLLKIQCSKDSSKRSMGQCILSLLSDHSDSASAQSLTQALTRFVLEQLQIDTLDPDTLQFLSALINVLLQLFPEEISHLMVDHIDQSHSGISRLVEVAATNSRPREVRLDAFDNLEKITDCLDRSTEPCTKMLMHFPPALCRSILCNEQDNELRNVLLRCLAKLCVKSTTSDYLADLLDPITSNLDKDSPLDDDLLGLRYTIVQYLYCIVLYHEDGLDRLRKSRHVIPRLVRRLFRELDQLYEMLEPEPSMDLIKMMVKLYHILLKDETSATNELHWRQPEIKAYHLTTMTRILYAEECENFDSVTQDLAMDLLEMAVSPEEGNDIYEVMGGISSD